jgi:hypothetical protein
MPIERNGGDKARQNMVAYDSTIMAPTWHGPAGLTVIMSFMEVSSWERPK